MAAATQKRSTKKTSYAGFSAEERAAMKEHAKELKAAASSADGEAQIFEKIAQMPETDRAIATRIHELIKEHAPELTFRLWYGMPAYVKDGNVLCFFQPAAKFKARYSTFGFNNNAMLDDGTMWPTAYAITKITPATETQLTTLIKKAVS
jgi:uncharacterized protein YdhG (YjbR/CyaY superfamily)